jgi:hypothetical protein
MKRIARSFRRNWITCLVALIGTFAVCAIFGDDYWKVLLAFYVGWAVGQITLGFSQAQRDRQAAAPLVEDDEPFYGGLR